MILPALPGRHRVNQQRNGGFSFNLQHPNNGIIMMLLILFVPIAFFSVKYSQKLFERRESMLVKADGPFYRKYYPAKVATAVAKAWNPVKTLGNQDQTAIYVAAYNSGAWCQNSALGGAIDGIILSNSSTTDDTSAPATSGPSDAPTTSEGKAAQAKKDIAITVEGDKINVTCNKISTYALPAECNLDLVLAVPTNSDAAVEEIGKVSANFLKDNFDNTRGVYTSIIPYSGKLLLPSNRYDGWTEAFPNFSNPSSITLYSLYGTSNISGTTGTAYNSAGTNNGYSIMCRASLFDTTSASTSKYKRMNINPCTSFVLSATSGITSPVYTTYTANQPSIMELTADLSTAYTKCNGLTLPSDAKNTSSFSFAALEWANNMFQNWTTDPKISTVAGGNNGILSNPSKTTSGRKKVVVLIVNKPDTFTDGELTYLGLSDDADEAYTELNWTETTMPYSEKWMLLCYGGGKFVATYNPYDNIMYDRLTGDVVYSSDGISWTQSSFGPWGSWSSICYGNGKFVAVAIAGDFNGSYTRSNKAAYSSNGINWSGSGLPSQQYWHSVCYGGGKFVAIPSNSNTDVVAYSNDGANWTQSTLPSTKNWYLVFYGGGKFIAVSTNDHIAAYSTDGINWTQFSLPSTLNNVWQSACYGGGKFVSVTNNSTEYFNITGVSDGKVAYSSDGINWTQSDLPATKKWRSVCYGSGKFVTIAQGSNVVACSSDGIHWTEFTLPSSQNWYSLCYGDGKFFAIACGSNVAAYGEFVVKTNTVGNKALKDTLGNGTASDVTTLTTNACNKLKETYGGDIRIDIVKYKASGAGEDYQYLKDCAEGTGGKLYNAGDEISLKSTLDTIAAGLKTWAGYQEARVVN